ncbi:MAG: ParB N-terminal domain-containing protein [bacterium]
MQAPRKTELIDVDAIKVPLHRRQLSESAVASMMESIRNLGMRTPITVRMLDEEATSEPELVTGGHRLEAAKRLGWERIECFVVEHESDALARLWEIDENLIRHALSPAQEAAAIAERKAIYEELHPETKHGGDRKSDQVRNLQSCSFVESTAEATGKHASTVSRAAARGEALGSDIDAVVGTSLDKGVELDALAKMAPEERAPIIERAKAGEKVSARTHDVVYLEQAADLKEAEKRNGTANRVVEMNAAEQFAQWLLERSDLGELDVLVSWLQGTKPKDVIAYLRRKAA